ncbi:cobalt-precorrin-5B (C(1))-methyltransferase CbiD [[Clostridium] polysaccharolyticum]|uniref:Cobalt-precorrin-5B C(1)-methyltransferase n=1 Tax=[Clostridium] polysaccharolyticum TaxID=29364 RepID=A0A1H9Y491_9FIRM|nr:cobalt-precorrin-5B (C(1))-methyltransferase CbiD [[Clostridium] polysaccharolyticum]SES63680.1 cobalt-precorrin 5B C1-methyltransferase [[Clostridium] polysaccharolyticum]
MKEKKQLRFGFTTGTCAAIAAKAAARMLLGEELLEKEQIMTPKGILVCTSIYDAKKVDKGFSCAVKKDAGDDPDVTNGILIYSTVELLETDEIVITGGEGVGIVTKAGLHQEIGEYAINPVPKKMIEKEVREVLERKGYFCGALVTIHVPEGKEIAKRTFNPRIGIVDGISILGTSGIVEPMSEKALLESISVEMNVAKANGTKRLILTPGNYGEEFIRDSLKLELSEVVKCSNFVGETIDMAVEKGFESILLIGHIGKFVKLAAGIMNTHSHQADGRMEVFVAHAALVGVPSKILKNMMESVTTDEVIGILQENGYLEPAMESIMKKVDFHIRQRCLNEVPIGAVLFSNKFGLLGITNEAERLLKC